MLTEQDVYKEILLAVHKKSSERLDSATENVSFTFHSITEDLPEEARRNERVVMRVLSGMVKEGLFSTSGSPIIYKATDLFSKKYTQIVKNNIAF